MEIEIPSPSVFLKPSPTPGPALAPPVQSSAQKLVKSKSPTKSKKSSGFPQDAISVKPKQSKSRNGCATCKKKRLKCDETKPACAQCLKRNVVCEGYKKDFKWRTFEETTLNSRIVSKKKTGTAIANATAPTTTLPIVEDKTTPVSSSSSSHVVVPPPPPPPLQPPSLQQVPSSVPGPSSSAKPTSPLDEQFDLNSNIFSPLHLEYPSPKPSQCSSATSFPSAQEHVALTLPPLTSPPPSHDIHPWSDIAHGQPSLDTHPNTSDSPPSSLFILDGVHDDDVDEQAIFRGIIADEQDDLELDDEDIDDDIRRVLSYPEQRPPELLSDLSTSSYLSLNPRASPILSLASPEMLLMRFDRQTCGILSVKDGPTENPWRTLVWPLARDSQALYHAISSMTAFHGAYKAPILRTVGVRHMNKSIRQLLADIENMPLESALATSLVLAFGEGWDVKTTTGIQHLRGARIMIDKALVRHQVKWRMGQLTAQDAVRLRFLCNTFIYMDVIARLTSDEEAPSLDLEDIFLAANSLDSSSTEVDPLMGCATTLFPLIGRVANLIQKVRKADTNSLAIVSHAMELKQQLLQWQCLSSFVFEEPEDPSSDVQHSIQTAEAYRLATLLYLHQAVPEIPADAAAVLAKRVLMLLASVPLSSRTTIVHIYPLFVASCEITELEDRAWVTERWSAMSHRLQIGNVDSCWRVVQEVWRRRDHFEAEKTQRLMRRYAERGLSTGNLFADVGPPANLHRRVTMQDVPQDRVEVAYMVRGHLHWLGVMAEWGWEGKSCPG